MPCSSSVYLSRARWRSSRLPKSRWVATIASTTSAEVVGRHPGDRAAEHRIGVVGPGVAHAHPAAGEHDEPGQLAGETLAQGRDDADVVRMDVDAVVARPGDADLELARQVGVAVQRFRPGRPRAAASAVTARSPSTHSSQYDGVRGRNRRTSSATTGASTARRSACGRGHAITLRTTSPHAASVVSNEPLMPCTTCAAHPWARSGTALPAASSGASHRRRARRGGRGRAIGRGRSPRPAPTSAPCTSSRAGASAACATLRTSRSSCW